MIFVIQTEKNDFFKRLPTEVTTNLVAKTFFYFSLLAKKMSLILSQRITEDGGKPKSLVVWVW